VELTPRARALLETLTAERAQVWSDHINASVSEGLCPLCGRRLDARPVRCNPCQMAWWPGDLSGMKGDARLLGNWLDSWRDHCCLRATPELPFR
jgi:hypothetical protein